ncbi:MAG TPA: hypothetical protein VMC85_07730 [Desulfomonilaceae bacterium]|nr:hypothetical protein [Desulfomonilaceae bacterium]
MEIVLDRWHSASYAQAHEKLDLFSNVTAVCSCWALRGPYRDIVGIKETIP